MRGDFKANEPYKWLESHCDDSWQFGEQSLIDAIIGRIGDGSRCCFEVGAGDGDSLPVTCGRLIERGWRAELWEANPDSRVKLSEKYSHAIVHGEFHVAENVPCDDGVVVVDVDGLDYYFLRRVLLWSPNLILCEHADKHGEGSDELFVPTVDQATISPIKQATEQAIVQLASHCNYVHIGSTRVNSFFVRNDLLDNLL